jgi:polar amino acid transport system substrate-binding protein
MRTFYKLVLPVWLRGAACLAVLTIFLWCSAKAEDAACEPAKLASKYPGLAGKTIKVGQDGESVPFSMRDPKDFSKLIGLDADLAQATFACIGVPMQFQVGTWAGLIPAAMAGQVDVMWDTLLYTPERAKKLDFLVYMNAATGMLVAKGNPKNIHALGDLCGLTSTTTLGTTQEAMLRDASSKCVAAGKPAVNIITSTDMPSGLRLVQNARADLVSVNKVRRRQHGCRQSHHGGKRLRRGHRRQDRRRHRQGQHRSGQGAARGPRRDPRQRRGEGDL